MYVRPPSAKKYQEPGATHSQILEQIEEKIGIVCFICSHTYNTTNRKPKIVCRRQHTYCAECVGLISRARPLKCPECRFKIYEENIFVNRAILAVCEHFPSLRKQIDSTIEENHKLKSENLELKEEMMRLKDKLNRVQVQSKQKDTFPEGKQAEQTQELKNKTKESLSNQEDRKRVATLKKPYIGRPNPESSPIKGKRAQTKEKRSNLFDSRQRVQQLQPQLQVFCPMVRLYRRGASLQPD